MKLCCYSPSSETNHSIISVTFCSARPEEVTNYVGVFMAKYFKPLSTLLILLASSCTMASLSKSSLSWLLFVIMLVNLKLHLRLCSIFLKKSRFCASSLTSYNTMLRPDLPALPVRPLLCTNESTSMTLYCMTTSMLSISSPLDATSVATSIMSLRGLLYSLRMLSREDYYKSPCRHPKLAYFILS